MSSQAPALPYHRTGGASCIRVGARTALSVCRLDQEQTAPLGGTEDAYRSVLFPGGKLKIRTPYLGNSVKDARV